MNYLDNINYRKQLDEKVRTGLKLTRVEKEWCAINPMYNESYKEPCYQKDIIELLPNCTYQITIALEQSVPLNETIPLISVPLGKGEIIAHRVDADNCEVEFSTKRLGVLLSCNKLVSTFLFRSITGHMCVEYECEYFDPKAVLLKREPSILNFAYGMKREILDDNKIRYACKHPLDDKQNFRTLIFTLTWKKIM